MLHLKTEVVVVFGSDANAVIPPSKGFRATLQATRILKSNYSPIVAEMEFEYMLFHDPGFGLVFFVTRDRRITKLPHNSVKRVPIVILGLVLGAPARQTLTDGLVQK